MSTDTLTFEQVTVANTRFNFPVPGLISRTDEGDVIVVHEPITKSIGIHGPESMDTGVLSAICDAMVQVIIAGYESFTFNEDTADMIVEDSFFWHTVDTD